MNLRKIICKKGISKVCINLIAKTFIREVKFKFVKSQVSLFRLKKKKKICKIAISKLYCYIFQKNNANLRFLSVSGYYLH